MQFLIFIVKCLTKIALHTADQWLWAVWQANRDW